MFPTAFDGEDFYESGGREFESLRARQQVFVYSRHSRSSPRSFCTNRRERNHRGTTRIATSRMLLSTRDCSCCCWPSHEVILLFGFRSKNLDRFPSIATLSQRINQTEQA